MIELNYSAKSFAESPVFLPYSKVIIQVSEDLEVSAGDDTGRVMTLENPNGTADMAAMILARIKGKRYQPFTASGVRMDPAAELGDRVQIGSVESNVFELNTKLGRDITQSIAAPADEQIDHEYPYQTQQERTIKRQNKTIAEVKSQLIVQADKIAAEVLRGNALAAQLLVQAEQISAKVSRSGGGSSFGWTLNDTSWTLQADGQDVLKADKDGIKVTGNIDARTGSIGGFTIGAGKLTTDDADWGKPTNNGIYIGPSGIQLGKSFSVDFQGNLEAETGTFHGFVRAGNIEYGGESGTFSGYGLTGNTISNGKIVNSTLELGKMVAGIGKSCGYADFAHDVMNNLDTANYISTQYLGISANFFAVGSHNASWKSKTLSDGSTIYYLGRAQNE